MNLVILDLEWNGSYSRKRKRYVNEIIEFGAVKCSPELELLDTFSCLVRPQITKKLSSVIADLTHISDDALTQGVPFTRAASMFQAWAKDCVIMTWSTSDVLTLIEDCRYFYGSPKVPFLKKYCNLQDYVQNMLNTGTQEQLGLLTAAELLGLQTDESEHHRALDDSRVAFDILRKIYNPDRLQTFIQTCSQEFYDKITFKTSYITDLENPLIKRRHLRFDCPKCRGKAIRKTDWTARNRSFHAEFQCGNCGNSFAGRLILKLKYEGLNVNRKTFPLPIIEPPAPPVAGTVSDMTLKIAENGTGLLQFPAFSEIPGITHCFSTRIGGVSKNEFAAMNLTFNRGDPQKNVEENYRRLAEALNLPCENFVAGAQDHNINIRRVSNKHAGLGIWRKKDMESIDGLCTDTPYLPLVIYCSDCVPLYYYDKKHNAIGLAHAGWKGTALGMASAMVERMTEEFGTDPKDLAAAIGPSICDSCYEVDYPVAEVFEALENHELFVREGENSKYHVSLWECNRQGLLSCGVPAENIHVGNVCSMENSRLIFSHRKTRGHRGGNAAVLALT